MADPERADEIMTTPLAAHQLGFHVGGTIPYGVYTQAQQEEPGIGTPRVAPAIRFTAKLVGLATLSSEIVEDDIDRVPTFIILTPALAREVLLLSVSHDLRTPLTSIRGFAEAITDGAVEDSSKAAEVILAESRAWNDWSVTCSTCSTCST